MGWGSKKADSVPETSYKNRNENIRLRKLTNRKTPRTHLALKPTYNTATPILYKTNTYTKFKPFIKKMLPTLFILSIVSGALCVRDDGYYGPQTFQNQNDNRQSTQYSEPDAPRAPPSAILTHKQGLSNDGVFNYIFAADNGLKQGESIAPDGTRTGAYQYIDPNGKTIFVKYMAGKDGFKILEGDHIPRQPEPVEPIPEYQPPEYRKDYKQPEPNQKKGIYKTDSENYQQEDNRNQRYQQPSPKYQQQQENQRYTTPIKQQPKQQSQYFQQQGGQGGQGGQGKQGGRPMLYNVEQRHNVNYRKYQEDGRPVSKFPNTQIFWRTVKGLFIPDRHEPATAPNLQVRTEVHSSPHNNCTVDFSEFEKRLEIAVTSEQNPMTIKEVHLTVSGVDTTLNSKNSSPCYEHIYPTLLENLQFQPSPDEKKFVDGEAPLMGNHFIFNLMVNEDGMVHHSTAN
ncbi:uncharacterized protein LOC143912528 [Arctopsyche grandis]|uniref:uncharacterized protein LOC143912528 n=1 Tax=Arctopsyche grandis TaxID=121162 RepID=UPI00406D77B9